MVTLLNNKTLTRIIKIGHEMVNTNILIMNKRHSKLKVWSLKMPNTPYSER